MTLIKFIFLTIWLALIWKLFSTSSHILLVLLLLEVFMLSVMLLLNISNPQVFHNSAVLMMFFTLAVCEASLGLGLLIQISRKNGSDLLSCV